jgi:hypothetical protein
MSIINFGVLAPLIKQPGIFSFEENRAAFYKYTFFLLESQFASQVAFML